MKIWMAVFMIQEGDGSLDDVNVTLALSETELRDILAKDLIEEGHGSEHDFSTLQNTVDYYRGAGEYVRIEERDL